MMLPHMVFYTNRFISDGMAGAARGPVITIRLEYKNDIPLLRHELEHVKQWYMFFTPLALVSVGAFFYLDLSASDLFGLIGFSIATFPLLSRFVHPIRLWAESSAYAVQVKAGADIDRISEVLSSKHYDLGISAMEAKKAILKHLPEEYGV